MEGLESGRDEHGEANTVKTHATQEKSERNINSDEGVFDASDNQQCMYGGSDDIQMLWKDPMAS